jgi:hypothetical protein
MNAANVNRSQIRAILFAHEDLNWTSTISMNCRLMLTNCYFRGQRE